jgi:hypothetical protein
VLVAVDGRHNRRPRCASPAGSPRRDRRSWNCGTPTPIRPFSPDDGAGNVRSRLRIVAGGDPREIIARAVAEEGADLLVIAARGARRTANLAIRSTADYPLAARLPRSTAAPRMIGVPGRSG